MLHCCIDEGEGKNHLCFSRKCLFGPDISAFGHFGGGCETLKTKTNPGYFLKFWCPLAIMLPRLLWGVPRMLYIFFLFSTYVLTLFLPLDDPSSRSSTASLPPCSSFLNFLLAAFFSCVLRRSCARFCSRRPAMSISNTQSLWIFNVRRRQNGPDEGVQFVGSRK